MHATIDIDDDVLLAAKDMAQRECLTPGQVISPRARLALTVSVGPQPSAHTVGGFRPLPARGVVVSNDQDKALRQTEGV